MNRKKVRFNRIKTIIAVTVSEIQTIFNFSKFKRVKGCTSVPEVIKNIEAVEKENAEAALSNIQLKNGSV